MTRREFRAFAWALVALSLISQAAAWGASCSALGVAREAVRGRAR